MPSKKATLLDDTAFGFGMAFALNAQGQAQDWIMLIPPGPRLQGFDGRAWTMTDAGKVADATMAPGAALPIDINHAQFLKAPKGDESPAVGWIEAVEARAGALWGRVAWNKAGTEALLERSYRYISPVFTHDKGGAVIALSGAGLTNKPNFTKMPALNSAEEGVTMENLLAKLGLPKTASENDAIAAVDKLTTAANAARTPPSLEQFVPRADYDQLNGRFTALNTQIDTEKKAARTADVAAFLDGAVKAGKIAPASKDQYLALCAREDGFASVKKLVETMPSFFTQANLDEAARNGGGGEGATALNAQERELLKQTDITEAEFLAAKKVEAARAKAH
jgi:phage I-like protein